MTLVMMKMILILSFTLKKQLNEELNAIAWYPKRRCDCCMSEYEQKEIDPIFIEKL